MSRQCDLSYHRAFTKLSMSMWLAATDGFGIEQSNFYSDTFSLKQGFYGKL